MCAMQSRLDNSNLPFILSGEAYANENGTIKQDGARATPLASLTVMGKRRFALATTGTANAGNTGNGTVTAVAKIQDGKNLIIGNYNLECTGVGVNGRVAGSVTANAGNTGNGTVTSLAIVSGEFPEVGNWILKVTDPNAGGTASAVAAATGGNTGNGTASAVTTGTQVIEGVYTITCHTAVTNGGIFSVVDPNGDRLKDLTVGAAYATQHINLTISDGATDFIVGDSFTVTVTIDHGSQFTLTDPDGVNVKTDIRLPGTPGGTVNVNAGGISFTITDGSTDFALNDYFTLVVSAAQGGVFKLADPYTNTVATGLTLSGVPGGATTFNAGGMTFTVNDGSTDFIIGDKFNITVSADGDYVPLKPTDLLGGAEFAGIYRGDTITAAALVAGDVLNCPMITGGRCTIDHSQLVFENGLTIASVLPSGKTVREEMAAVGIFLEDVTIVDEYENT